jgi:hypothetical protein
MRCRTEIFEPTPEESRRPMTIPYLPILVLSVCAMVFYRAGQMEKSWGVLWAGLSVLVSFLALRFLPWGLGGVFAGQVLLFVGITCFRMWRRG